MSNALPNLKGRVAFIFEERDFDVDQIIGVKNIKIQDVDELAALAMQSYDPEFQSKVRKGDVVVGADNFGYGHPHYPPMRAMRHLGIAGVIAESFSPGYWRGEISMGFPQVSCPGILGFVERWDELEVVDRRGRDERDPAERRGLQREAGHDERPSAGARRDEPGERRHEDRHDRPRQRPEPGLEPAVVLDDRKNCASRKIEPNIPKYISSDTALAALNVRERNRRSGSIGSAVRASQPMNARIPTTPRPSESTISGLPQPSSLPRTRP